MFTAVMKPSSLRSSFIELHNSVSVTPSTKRRRRRKIDPYAYLRDVLTRLPSMTTGQIAAITPANWISPANRPSQIAA